MLNNNNKEDCIRSRPPFPVYTGNVYYLKDRESRDKRQAL